MVRFMNPGKFLTIITKSAFRSKLRENHALTEWALRDFSSPAPQDVKMRVLRRWGGSNTWIETGTFLGHTSRSLADFSSRVYTIEPDLALYDRAKKVYKLMENITFINGLSEECLGDLISSLSPDERADVSFWLDGHFSAGITYQGPIDTPIEVELDAIAEKIIMLGNITIFVDDVRCFNPTHTEYKSYPDLNFLVKWANKMNLFWTIEQDIFIATNRANRPYLDPQ